MNENIIREIANQASAYAEATITQVDESYDEMPWDAALLKARDLKFTELIIEECYVALFPALRDMISRGQAYEMIKQHFGVGYQPIKIGSRVKVISGFNIGSMATVNYIEPSGKLWVRRDGAGSDVFYHPEEVVEVEENKGWVCPKCGADRTKIACPLGFGATVDGRCPMIATAQTGVK